MQKDAATLSDVRFSAFGSLAMREHSAKELRNKLERKFEDPALVDAVMEELIAQDLQSDERFTQAFISMRQRQGKGPLIIKMGLRERGIAAELIAECIDDSDELWLKLASDVRQKKFRGAAPIDQRERAKQMRFLQARGFSGRHIQAAFNAAATDD